MNLKTLLAIHAIITLAAGIVLIISPDIIPSTVNISLQPSQYLLCYFLAAAEIALAYLSWFGRKIEDKTSLSLIVTAIIIFHAATLFLELYAYSNGLSSKIIPNVIARVVIIILISYFGLYKMSKDKTQDVKNGRSI